MSLNNRNVEFVCQLYDFDKIYVRNLILRIILYSVVLIKVKLFFNACNVYAREYNDKLLII